jgi:hypothetical protein
MRALRRGLAREDGATLVIVALSLIGLMGMVVLTVDVGGLLAQRRAMVNTNDSAALSAAQSFAIQEALCGSNEGPAIAAADSLAGQNVGGTSRTHFGTDCAQQTVTVVYEKQQGLFFAPVLGFADSTPVNATATAQWGPAQGGSPMPIQLDPQLTADCVFEDPNDRGTFKPPGPCPTGYWYNNQDLTNSGWGLMNLGTWSATPNSNCSNAGANQIGNWINQTSLADVQFTSTPMYVCTDDGSRTVNWMAHLEAQIGKIVMFPVNDPAQMILEPPSRAQYAIIALAPMKIEAVYRGNDPEAIGTPGTAAQNKTCTTDLALGGDGSVNLGVRANQGCGAPATVDAIPYTSVEVFLGQGSNRVTYTKCPPSGGTNCDYRYDESSYVVQWVNGATQFVQNKQVTFNWIVNATPGTPGACGIQSSDPNAKCLVLSWAGPQLIGHTPGSGGPSFGAQAIALIK